MRLSGNKSAATSAVISLIICWLWEAVEPSWWPGLGGLVVYRVGVLLLLQIFSTNKTTMRNRKQGRVENLGHEIFNKSEHHSEVGQRSQFCDGNKNIIYQDDDEEEEEQEEDEPDHEAHYLLSDGKTYIVILCLIVLCGGIVVSNIFFPNRDRDKKNNEGK